MIVITVYTAIGQMIVAQQVAQTITGALCWLNLLQVELSDKGAYRYCFDAPCFTN